MPHEVCRTIYPFRTITVNTPGGGVWVQVFGGNSRRLVILLGLVSGELFSLANQDGAASAGGFLRTGINSVVVLPYRDFGPIIRSEIWIESEVAAQTITVTEITEQITRDPRRQHVHANGQGV